MISKIKKMTDIVVEYAGPIARYVVKAEINSMGYNEKDFPPSKLPLLARRVIDESIIEAEWKELCMLRVYREVLRK